MFTFTAVVRNGQLVLNQPVALPEGLELTLRLSEEELREALARAWADTSAEHIIPLDRLLERLRHASTDKPLSS